MLMPGQITQPVHGEEGVILNNCSSPLSSVIMQLPPQSLPGG